MSKLIVLKGTTGLTRLETFNSRSHLVVPIVALVESVMKGALAPADVFGKFPDGWNGRPVVINHPEKRGKPVSANSPDVLEEALVGQVFNSKMADKKLKMEVWIDLSRAEELGGVAEETINILKEGEEPIEISTGLFVETEQKEGKFNGEPYTEVWTETVPDHLAVLEHGATGECSLADGCGGPRINVSDIPSDPGKFFTYMKEKFELLFNKKHEDMNDVDIRRALQSAIEMEDFWSFVVAVEGNSFITENIEGLFRRDFSISDDGTISLGSESTKVRMETDFIEVKIETNEKEIAMNIEEKVDALIANEASNFEEGDKEYLLTLDEEKLDKFVPEEKVEAVTTVVTNTVATVSTTENNSEEEASPEDWIKGAPKNVQEVLSFGLKAHEARKAELTEKIIKHNGNKFTEDDLSKMDIEMLTNVASLIPEEVADFSNRGGPRSHVDGEDTAIPASPSVVDLLMKNSANK